MNLTGEFQHHLVCSPFRSLSTGRLTDLLLKAAFGAQISEAGSNDSLNSEKPMEVAGKWGERQIRQDGLVLGESVCLHASYEREASFLMAFAVGNDRCV